jgi:hypothetical protein
MRCPGGTGLFCGVVVLEDEEEDEELPELAA